MNQSDEDKILKDLYQQGHKDEPSAALDQLILQHAKQSNQVQQSKTNWRPWLAAASVVLVMPLIWLLLQNEQLLDQAAPHTQISQPQKPKPAKELYKQEYRAEPESALSEEIQMAPAESNLPAAAPAADMALEADDLQDTEEQEKIVVTGSRIKQEDLETESVKANREVLLNEFKAKKKTFKQSNLDPILAMELQRFEMYLEEGKTEEAAQLLREMQEREPDFDYSELEQRLADAQQN